jgi:drug/metabolite transporter (DMT)-like permease
MADAERVSNVSGARVQGVVASGIGYLLLTYCVEKRGPVFTAAFSPLAQIFVAGIDLFILHEPLYLGR